MRVAGAVRCDARGLDEARLLRQRGGGVEQEAGRADVDFAGQRRTG